jgi:PAS domain S-box-containing protein
MEISEELALMRFALDQTTEPVCWVNAEGYFIHANAIFHKTFGTRESKFRNIKLAASFQFSFRKEKLSWDDFFELCRREKKVEKQLAIQQEGKKKQHFLLSAFLLEVEGKTQICLIFRDMTEEKKASKVRKIISQQINEALFEYPLMVFALDKKGVIRFWNKKMTEITGFPMEEVVGEIGETYFPDYSPETVAEVMAKIPPDVLYLDINQKEAEITCRDGSIKHIHWIYRFDRKLIKSFNIWGLGIDVTDRNQSRQALMQSEQRFSTISKATNDAVWDWDLLTGNMVWNDGISQIFGYPADEIVNKIAWWEDNIHPEDRHEVVSRLNRVIETGETHWSDEYRFQRRDGSYAFVYDKGIVIKDEEGKSVRMIGGILDITDRKIFEQNLILKNRQLSEFAFFNSHKLRAPLARLMGIAYLLKGEDLFSEAEHRELFDRIVASAEELDRMTRDIASLLI